MNNLFESHDFYAEKAAVPSLLKWGNPGRCPDPRITVIMPVYKRPEFFAKALRSVLAQDYADSYEVVVVDNNEEPTSPNQAVVEQMADPRVRYYRNAENLGMYQNWNRGIELARSPYVTFCHDDDLLLPGALRILMQLAPITGKACVLSAYHTVDGAGNMTGTQGQYHRHGFLKPRKLARYTKLGQYLGNVSCGDGCLYHRQSMLDLGGYDATRYPVADYALHVLYARRFGAWICNEPTSCYRIADNESMQVYELFPDAIRALHACMRQEKTMMDRGAGPLVQALDHDNQLLYRRFWSGSSGRALSMKDRCVLWVARKVNLLNKFTVSGR